MKLLNLSQEVLTRKVVGNLLNPKSEEERERERETH